MTPDHTLARRPRKKCRFPWLPLVAAVGTFAMFGAGPESASAGHQWQPFEFLTSPTYGLPEKVGLIVSLLIALCGIGYAFWLAKQVYAAGTGTTAMQAVALAVRQGADAYLKRQFTVVGILLVVLTGLIIAAKWPWQLAAAGEASANERIAVTVGRGIAFLIGAIFSGSVGFIGMRLATAGNVRVAQAARKSFGDAMRLAYRCGTVTGMFTCGLGLLGGTLILVVFGELAYETLLGFGFGGSLLALFMRVGGGIYTKAADVGADLVGKIEKDIPEDDPRNAATIADNVGDNVGDCAGMAADVFESYAVTMVAAVILGYAALGYKGMILPLLMMAVGVVSSLISTAMVGRGMTTGNATTAMNSINWGFWRSALISAVGFFAVGYAYLQYDATYVVNVAIDRGLYADPAVQARLKLDPLNVAELREQVRELRRDGTPEGKAKLAAAEDRLDKYRGEARERWKALPDDQRAVLVNTTDKRTITGEEAKRLRELNPAVVTEGSGPTVTATASVTDWARLHYSPLPIGLDWKALVCCLIGLVLAVALNRCTEYWTSTDYSPVKEVVKSSRTGHATNIISGLALGYESSVWAVLIISAALLGAVMVYSSTDNLLFIAFGVAMTGVGMLALTGDTISMDVFGPIADNANGVGEMAFNRDDFGQPLPADHPERLPEAETKATRQILADLDAVGNTTKAITKGIAIGSAVIASVSLFASFIAVLVTGAEEKIGQLTVDDFKRGSANLTVADPYVFIGMLIGGAVPLLFSSFTIRAVGRAAYLIVNECRKQFRDPDIWAGKKKPDYGSVVDICTGTAQKELVGPGLLAIGTPLVVGFLLGPYALGGFLAGMILVGQLLAVFMSNAGGAWDNAKKMIEDEPKDMARNTGKGSEKHKASVTGDTVGDPLKDTAGPAINPLIKVMNMVSLLALPLALQHNVKDGTGDWRIGAAVIVIAAAGIAWAWWQAKRESAALKQIDEEMNAPGPSEPAAGKPVGV
jgi:K(+)-stimulated pyrophosphate-energized sodium pump